MKRPKRSRKKDNPYTLEVSGEKYYVLFKDSKNILRNIEVRKDVFDLMDRFELDDVCEINEYKRHIEHSEIYEWTINSRSVYKHENLEDIILKKYEYQDLLNFPSPLWVYDISRPFHLSRPLRLHFLLWLNLLSDYMGNFLL